MADAPVEMKPTLGLTGLTMNAMALIAPGAFLVAHVRRASRCRMRPHRQCGSVSSSPLRCVWPLRFVMRKWQSSIPEPEVLTTLPSNPF